MPYHYVIIDKSCIFLLLKPDFGFIELQLHYNKHNLKKLKPKTLSVIFDYKIQVHWCEAKDAFCYELHKPKVMITLTN